MKNNIGLTDSQFKLLNGVDGFVKGNIVKVTLFDDYLTINSFLVKQSKILNYAQITDVFFGLTTIREKVKMSTLFARATTGTLFLGDLGSVIGVLSANGKKKKMLFVISYISSKGEKRTIYFENIKPYKGKKLSETLKKLCNIPQNRKTEVL